MAAELMAGSPKNRQKKKPILINKLELNAEIINMAVFIPHEDSVITVSSDKTIRVWIQRDNGQYWPSICHYMQDVGVCLDYNRESGKVFVGLSNGVIQEYDLSDDCNKLALKRDYIAHTKSTCCLRYELDYSWLLSCGNDKYFQWHCTKTGKRVCGYAAKAQCQCLQFDIKSCYLFMGDASGEVHVLKLSDGNLKPITTLKGHSGSINCLAWDMENKMLYSGSFDNSIIIWDIGGKKGSAYELHGHTDKVQGMALAPHIHKLFTAGDDQLLLIWDMKLERDETPTWSQSDMCEKCASPFFWNFKRMWDEKSLGVRQHHCRKCGRAICMKCSSNEVVLPKMGYEFKVRVCNECFSQMDENQASSTTAFHDLRHEIKHLTIDLSKGRMLTCGADDVVKIWDIRQLLT